ncbi:MAG: hypothetical protein RLZZ436_2090 [Planctomycetota bacterium]|jgi:hypothetical protein
MARTNLLLSVFFVVGLVGCGGAEGQKPVYPVSGKVTMAGAAVAKATVIFQPLGKDQAVATAITDAEGVYRLTTYDSFDGAAAGKYEVMVTKTAAPAASNAPTHDPTGANSTGASAPVHNAKKASDDTGATIDPKWGKPGNGLSAEVKSSGENTIDLKLD